MVANNAVDAEKMAKTWLVRMARDCNRYCKIMVSIQRTVFLCSILNLEKEIRAKHVHLIVFEFESMRWLSKR